MKYLTISTILFISFLTVNSLKSQQTCLDVVHPTDYRVSISNCCIKDVKEGNIVVFTKKGLTSEIEAVAINLDGGYYELNNQNVSTIRNLILLRDPEWEFMGEDYEFHQLQYNKAKSKIIMGSVLIPLGVGLVIGGTSVMGKSAQEWPENNANGAGILLFLSGFAAIGVGIPITISGAVKKHKSKNAMDEIKRTKALSIRTGPKGITLVYNF